ncbi:PP2C family protein-serine/threonine phosphatase [Streptomyces sp. NPDC052107]|uniref:PP2C family protein-serine/threonine phosphatase n=1 Tax=Streptomyces sp. NPDC052107 TaxID=3155632 RepID=UPI0034346703
MGVQAEEPIPSRCNKLPSLARAMIPKRLPERMREMSGACESMLVTPLLVIALDTTADLLAPNLQFNRLLGVAPALAAAMWPVAGTLGIGLLALIAGIALAATHHDLGQTPSVFTVVAITAVTLAAAYASRVRQHRERTLAAVRSVAETAQHALRPPIPRHLGHVDIDTVYQAAAAHARIGGDFYEARRTPHGVRLIIGDVRGKGLPAVEAASTMLSSFRANVRDAPDLPYLANTLETSMQQHFEEVLTDDTLERFVTIVLAEIPAEEPIARLVNCGHPPPLLLHNGEVREVEPSAPSPPINMAALLGDHYQLDTIPFTVGDRLLLYTDGISESRDLTGTFYPLTQRIRRWVSAPPHQLLHQLHRDINAYVPGTRDDDVAALVAHRVTPGERRHLRHV